MDTRQAVEALKDTLRTHLAEDGDEYDVVAWYLVDLPPSARATIIARTAQFIRKGYAA